MIDTHSHLDGEEFRDDLGDVIQRAMNAGVKKIFIPAICLKDLPQLITTCKAYPEYLYPMIGLHPENIMDEDYKTVLHDMENMLEKSLTETPSGINPGFIAIGEVGLDLYWDDTYKEKQIEVFETQIQWSVRYGLPLMIHCRKAHNELMEIMGKYRDKNLSGVFHCFTGSEEEARDLLSFPNFCLGIGGVLTFKKSKLPTVVKNAIPLERIVLETDSPYMAPVPNRGKRNESAYIVEVAKMLSQIFEKDIDEIDRITTENALKTFRKV